jgi:sulfur relay (sulfurtransferase) complex TusBCD TusD component (DsrE family)
MCVWEREREKEKGARAREIVEGTEKVRAQVCVCVWCVRERGETGRERGKREGGRQSRE